ncbi:MAG: adenylate/guanylate cyclase domain-containing protein [Bacteroidia bacterium]
MSSTRLAAIMFTDIVGYTAMMQTDQAKAMGIVKQYEAVLKDRITHHKGELLQTYGDGSLSIFESASAAVRSAKELQEQVRDQVPLRIGIHLGEITIDGEHTFGDGVNIASRVESMGVAGAVLISSNIRQQIKNKPEFALQALGKFSFKNVSEPMTVYALANEGFAVPKPSEMKGKGKRTPNPRRLIRLASIGFIAMAVGVAIFWAVGFSNTDKSESLSKAEREKRVAVQAFENKTGEAELEDYGLMISDWITKGLMETGEANVVSAANLQLQIEQAGLQSGMANPKFADATGVDILLQGRYYLQKGELIIQSQIVEVATGKILHALDVIEGPRDQMRSMLEQLTQKSLGYWAVREQARFAQNPPEYEAFQAYQSGKVMIPNREESPIAIQHLTRAHELDSSFFAPLLRLVAFYKALDRNGSVDSLYQHLNKKRMQMTKWEQLTIEGIIAVEEGNNLKAAKLAEQRYQMDPSSGEANITAGQRYYMANYLDKAKAILEAFDTRFLNPNRKLGTRPRVMASLYFTLKEYEAVVKVAETYPYEVWDGELAYFHLDALTHLERWDELEAQIAVYKQKKDIRWFEEGRMYQRICSQLYLMGRKAELKKYTEELRNTNQDDLSIGAAAFFQGLYPEAISSLTKVLHDSTQSVFPRQYAINLLANSFVKLGDTTQLPKLEKELLSLSNQPATLPYHQAIIKTAKGQEAEAIRLLSQSIDAGLRLDWVILNQDVFLEPLFDNPDFQKLLKSKG